MSVSPEHEALHRIFQHDPALFARAVARTLDIEVTEPRRMSELNVDLTETRPIERRADSPKPGSATRPACRYGGR